MGEMGDERADWRVIEEELERRGKNASWLAQRLGYKQVQTAYNWNSAEISVCSAPRVVCPCLLLGQARCR